MIKRSDGRWQEAITIGGKRKFFYGKTKKELLDKLRAYEYKEERGKLFAEVVDEWQEEHYKDLVPSTIRGYNPADKRSRAWFENTPINLITASDINLKIREMASQRYSKKSVNTQRNFINMVMNFAVLHGYRADNPCIAVKLPNRLPHKPRQLPCDSDLKAVEKSDWLLPAFLLYTGCRRGEALAVTYEDIDFDNKRIHINKAVGYDGNTPFIKTPKTASGVRDVPLLAPLEARLNKNGKGLVFSYNGELYSNAAIQWAWEAWQKKEHVTVTMHQLRHAYATILYDAGIEVKDAQNLMGHATVAMTMDIYTHVRKQRETANADRLNDYLREKLD